MVLRMPLTVTIEILTFPGTKHDILLLLLDAGTSPL